MGKEFKKAIVIDFVKTLSEVEIQLQTNEVLKRLELVASLFDLQISRKKYVKQSAVAEHIGLMDLSFLFVEYHSYKGQNSHIYNKALKIVVEHLRSLSIYLMVDVYAYPYSFENLLNGY